MKGFFDNSDPNAKPGEFPKCPAGTYEVLPIIEWVTRADKNDPLSFPVYKPDQYRGQVAVLRFARKDGGTPVPVLSATDRDLVMLVRAFGGDPSKLPQNRISSEFLIAVEDAIKKGGKNTKVDVKDTGWVSNVHGATPPEGLYQWKLVEARSLDSSIPLVFQKDNYGGESIYLFFEIAGNMMGKPTAYDGYRVLKAVRNPFDGSEGGIPRFKVNENGSKPMDVVRLEKLVGCFCPDVVEHDWQSAANSPYGVDEADNPIIVIVDKAIKAGRKAVGQFQPNKNGRLDLDLKSLTPVEEEDIQVEELPEDDLPFDVELWVDGSPFATQHSALADFASWILKQCPGAFVKVPVSELDELVLTPKGKKWANDNLPKLIIDAGVTLQAKPVNQYTEEECAQINAQILRNASASVSSEFAFA